MYGLFTPERYQGSPLILPPAGRALMAFFAAALLAGLVVGVVLLVRAWPRWPRGRQTAVVAYALAAAGALALSLANAVVVVFQPQGRYLLVAATGPLLLLVWGVARGARRRRAVAVAVAAYVAGAISLSIFGLTTAIAISG
jgi:peptidoglycan/LPS O-acetylase OafA/YrhL